MNEYSRKLTTATYDVARLTNRLINEQLTSNEENRVTSQLVSLLEEIMDLRDLMGIHDAD